MEKVISAGSSGITVKGKSYSSALLSLRNDTMLRALLKEQLPAVPYEAAVIGRKKKVKKALKKRTKRMHSWICFADINKNEVLILTPSVKALDPDAKALSAEGLANCLKEIADARRA